MPNSKLLEQNSIRHSTTTTRTTPRPVTYRTFSFAPVTRSTRFTTTTTTTTQPPTHSSYATRPTTTQAPILKDGHRANALQARGKILEAEKSCDF